MNGTWSEACEGEWSALDRRPLILRRKALMSLDELQRIEEAMLRILAEVGIAVLDDELRGRLSSRGLRTSGNRVFIERETALEFLEAERAGNGNQFREQPKPPETTDARIRLSVLAYAQNVHDIATDEIVPYSSDRLIEMTKLLHMVAERNVAPTVPGYPLDVPAPLQHLVQYQIAAEYCANAVRPVYVKSRWALPYFMEMAEVMGDPVRHVPIYVATPLTLGSEGLACALEFAEKLEFVTVGNMASLGAMTPINAGDAYAMLAAEVVGSALLVGEVLSIPVRWNIRLCPADLRTMAMILGSPEDLLLQLTNQEVNGFLHGREWSAGPGGIHSSAKLPGPQSCAEKASMMTAGALLGQRSFGIAGSLSLDEVFSPEELLYDMEIRDHVQRLVAGMDTDCDVTRCVGDVEKGVAGRGFMGLDSTLDFYRQQYWHPALYERDFLPQWQHQGGVGIRRRAHEMIRELIGRHDYEPSADVRAELEGIVQRARASMC